MVRGLVRRVMGIPEPAPAPASPPPPPAPPATPAPAPAITDYAGMGAMKRREAAAGLKNGGPVRGPGTGTSDSIHKKVLEGSYIMPADSTEAIGDDALQGMGQDVPVNISNGEYELPPEQVHAIGVQALDQMKNATHTPADAQGFKPQMFFANGGEVDDPLKRRPSSFGDAAAGAANPAVKVVPGTNPQTPAAAAPLPMVSDGMTPPSQRLAVDPNAASMGPPKIAMMGGGAPDVPTPGATTPPGTPMPVAPGAWSPPSPPPVPRPSPTPSTTGFKPNSFGDAAAVSANPGTTAALPAAPAPTAQPPISALDPAKTGAAFGIYPNPNSQFSSHANDNALARGVVAVNGKFQPATPMAPTNTRMNSRTDPRSTAFNPSVDVNAPAPNVGTVATGAPAQASVGFVPGGAPAATQSQVRAVDNAIAAAGPVAATDAASAAAPGASNHERVSTIAGPSAAETYAMADRIHAASNTGAPTMAVMNADFANRNADFNNGAALRTAAARGSWSPRRGFQADTAAIDAAAMPVKLAAEQAQTAARNASAEQISAQNNAGELQRTNVRDAGETGRTNIRAQTDTANNAANNKIAQGKLTLEQTTQGFQTSAARQMQDLQKRYLESKDPAEQQTLARQIREFQGKDAPARFKVAAGGQQVDANGTAYKVPDRVFNEQTGQFVNASPPAGSKDAPAITSQEKYKALPKGARYTAPNGQVLVKG
jgi:hypothetical protein